MSNQKGKSHNYPASRKPYERSQSGIGGRPSTKKSKPESLPKKAKYFDLLKDKQSGQRGQSVVPDSPVNEENAASSTPSDPSINIYDERVDSSSFDTVPCVVQIQSTVQDEGNFNDPYTSNSSLNKCNLPNDSSTVGNVADDEELLSNVDDKSNLVDDLLRKD